MDRIEDETVRYLFFLQVNAGGAEMPFPVDAERHPVEEDEEEETQRAACRRQRAAEAAAQTTIQDFTRNIQRKKESEMAALQFVGGDGSSTGPTHGRQAAPKSAATIPAPAAAGRSTKSATERSKPYSGRTRKSPRLPFRRPAGPPSVSPAAGSALAASALLPVGCACGPPA